ncbi:hypothetical protein [Burkholderia anthina]|uniref:hypothetical protein n=1 Tax=Burkholderia anthina TaxID=179879 RepID=UPI00075F6A36|nr:hypothetical protein [Burkholderia anthina]KWH65135.1 hypothetical protein WT63_09620 [Burkholderia anthina]
MTAMSSDGASLYDQAEIRAKTLEIWDRVFKSSNKVIKDAKDYGFLGMDVAPDPNIHRLLISSKLLAEVVTFLISQAELRDDTESARLMINAKQQLLRLELLANELKANNEDGFNRILAELNAQAVF